MKKKRRIILFVLILIVVITAVLVLQYYNPKVTIYNEYMTYTTGDDKEVWLNNSPHVYFEASFPWNILPVAFVPSTLKPTLDRFVSDSMNHLGALTRKYNMHYNVDYSIQRENGQVVVVYTGYGKLSDGTIETIDFRDSYPDFAFDDQTKNKNWIRPTAEWELPISGDELHDPLKVINPSYWDSIGE